MQEQIRLPENTDLKYCCHDGWVRKLCAIDITEPLLSEISENWVSIAGMDIFRCDFPFREKGPAGRFRKFCLVYVSEGLPTGAFYDCHFVKLINSGALFFPPLNPPRGFR